MRKTKEIRKSTQEFIQHLKSTPTFDFCNIPGFFFNSFAATNERNWIFRNLEFREKILEFSKKILEFREKILEFSRKILKFRKKLMILHNKFGI